jgi:hypothetical protein
VDLDLRPLEREMQDLMAEHGPAGAAVQIVDSVQEWANERGQGETNPLRQATAFPDIGLVVMVATLTEDSQGQRIDCEYRPVRT